MIYDKNETRITKQNTETNKKQNKKIKALNYKEMKQDLALTGQYKEPLKN